MLSAMHKGCVAAESFRSYPMTLAGHSWKLPCDSRSTFAETLVGVSVLQKTVHEYSNATDLN